MEKKTYDNSYDILANSETISNQFYLIQNDGPVTTKSKEQNITEMQQVKGVIENGNDNEECAAYDASSQLFVYNVAPEQLSIHDQFGIQIVENNVYTNTYLLQTELSTASQQIEQKCIEPPKSPAQPSVYEVNGSKPENDLTEITLSDEQYHILQQKGWILLESSDKIFVLNTLGLHDITKDEKLIYKLRNDLQEPDLERKLRTKIIYSEDTQKSPQDEDNKVEFVLIGDQAEDNIPFIINENEDVDMNVHDEPTEAQADIVEIPIEFSPALSNANENIETNSITEKPKCDSIKIKTKYNFKDIPEKIFLGKTVNGKKLFAKVTKKNNIVNNDNNMNMKKHDVTNKKSKEKKKVPMTVIKNPQIDSKKSQVTALDTPRFISLIQSSLRASSQVKTGSVDEISLHVSQLLRLPNMKETLEGADLVLTKMVAYETVHGKEIGQPSMITGTIQMQDDQGCFVHVPQLLQKLLEESESQKLKQQANPLGTKLANDVVDLFHIHVSVTQSLNKPVRTSIHLSKRKLPLDVLNDAKKLHPNPVYACACCGLILKSESLLKNHQNNQCLEAEDELTIDTDEIINSKDAYFTLTETGNQKYYYCYICQEKFSKLFNIQKHIKTHITNSEEKKANIYKCKMCPSTYHHSSTLSKHIVRMHLQTPQ